jgi:hypothetical protein
MNDEPHKGEGKNPGQDPPEDSRRDRLRLALRENLKRRKSQARGRSAIAAAPSEHDGPSPHQPGKKTK